jgi:hypothetical protein
MSKSLKKWALVVAAAGGTLFQLGCLGGNQNWWLILSILNEDLFG